MSHRTVVFHPVVFIAALSAWLLVGGCDRANDGVSADGGGDGGLSCGAPGQGCDTAAGCCVGACDTQSHTCALVGGACGSAGSACAVATECCSGSCIGGSCGGALC